MTAARIILAVVHTGSASLWLGAGAYNLFMVWPRAQAHLDSDWDFERLTIAILAGARFKVLAIIGLLAGTGIALTAMEVRDTAESNVWVTLITAKALLLVVVVTLFAYVSWYLWPRRLFAALDELASFHCIFRRVAIALTTLLTFELALGVAAEMLR